MNAKLKKILSLVIAVLMVVTLIAAAVSATVGTVFTRKTTGAQDLGPVYASGRYTSSITIDEVDVGGMAIVNMLSEIYYVDLVTITQQYDAKILEQQEKINEKQMELAEYKLSYKGSDDSDDSGYKSYLAGIESREEAIDELKEVRNGLVKELTEFHEGYTEEDFETLKVKLTEEKFLNSVGLMYLFSTGFGLGNMIENNGRDVAPGYEVADPEEEEGETENGETNEENVDFALLTILASTRKDYNTNTPSTLNVLSIMFGMVMLYALIFLTMIIGIILLINSIIKLIRLLKNIKNADEDLVDRLQTKILIGCAAIGFVLFAFVKNFAGSSVTLGAAYIMIGVAFIVDCISGAFVKLAKEGFKSETVVKSGLTLVSAILAVVLISVALSCCVGAVVTDKLKSFENISYQQIYNAKVTELYNATDFSDMNLTEYKEAISSIKNKASDHTRQYFEETETIVIIDVMIAAFATIFAVTICMSLFSRFAFRQYKTKTGEKREYGSQIVMAVLILVCAIFMSVFTVSDVDGLNSTLEKGDYKVFVGEYKEENTYDYTLYESLTEKEELLDKSIEELNNELADIDDEEDKATAVAVIENLERSKSCVKNSKTELEETALPLVGMIILAVIILALEVAYKVAPAKLAKILPIPEVICAPEAEKSEENNTEETAFEETASEETKAEEAKEDTSTEETEAEVNE